jgi:hypothetical protein
MHHGFHAHIEVSCSELQHLEHSLRPQGLSEQSKLNKKIHQLIEVCIWIHPQSLSCDKT